MASRNEHTGNLMQAGYTKEYGDNYDKVFTKKPERGRFRWCKDTKKFIPLKEWFEKYGEISQNAPMIFVDNFEAYDSPVTGEAITNRKKRDYDLKRNGCRPYEGYQNERKEADKFRKEQDSKLESRMMETVQETYHQIEHGHLKLGE